MRRSNAPLLAWGEALRATKTRRRKLVCRAAILGAGASILLACAAFPPAPRLIWNASASAPIGLYAVTPGGLPERGDLVVARVPERYRQLAAERRYLPINVPLVKRVAAAGGDQVCAQGPNIFVNGRRVMERLFVDSAGRKMPLWRGCVRLRGRQLFLLMDTPASFDGRYFGISEGGDVVGKARLIWAR
ncbi:S26 family signal peptidase [Sphingosinicella sp. GR2756]|uniref:S26 family signal peptidase n=2 Tax=Sphingosinicella rhizophila TaxID=3050082 RepID=A0ABU3Q5P9_9SPHN|nr:S26 family signal peptidase [Sphingosinicella sp. GR2756]MDT9598622.1 S26 family signal peptidase [Sphingosinicella sp. GR2756]